MNGDDAVVFPVVVDPSGIDPGMRAAQQAVNNGADAVLRDVRAMFAGMHDQVRTLQTTVAASQMKLPPPDTSAFNAEIEKTQQALNRLQSATTQRFGPGGHIPAAEESFGVRGDTYMLRRPERSLEEQGRRQVQAAALREMRTQEREAIARNRAQDELFAFDLNAEQRNRFAGTAGQSLRRGQDEGSGGRSVALLNEFRRGMGDVLKLVVAVEASIAVIDNGLSAAQFATAVISGDKAKIAKAAEAWQESMRRIPIFGERIVALGERINNLFTGNADRAKAITDAAERTSKAIDAQRAAAEGAQKAYENMQRTVAETRREIETLSKAEGDQPAARARARADERRRQIDEDSKAQRDAISKDIDPAIRLLRQNVSEADARVAEESTPGFGERPGGRQARLRRLAEAVRDQEQATAALNNAEKVKNELLQKADTESAAVRKAIKDQETKEINKLADDQTRQQLAAQRESNERVNAELSQGAATRLRLRRQFLAAELAEINAAQEREIRAVRERAAKEAEANPRFAPMIFARERREVGAIMESAVARRAETEQREGERINESTMESESRIRQSGLRAAGQDYRADLEAFEAAAAAKVRAARTAEEAINAMRENNAERAERRAEREQLAEDMRFDARGMRLRRHGQGEQADREAIAREAQRELEAAAGDEATSRAIIERARERLLDVQNRRAPAQILSGAEAFATDLRGNRPPDKELNELNKKQLEVLEKIRQQLEKGVPATTT